MFGFIAYNVNLFFTHSLLIHFSGKSGGGGGSGGAVSFSACTLIAGSSAKIQAKGGEGGDAWERGRKLSCHNVCLVILA